MAAVKIIQILGISKKSWEDAAEIAVKEAAKTVRHITGVDVVSQTAKVEDGKIKEFHTTVHIAFKVA